MRLARFLLILVTFVAIAAAHNHMVADPQPQNPTAPPQRANEIQADYPGQTHGDFAIKDFRFHNGESLSELRLHYFTLGTPHRNNSGQIDNAVLLLHGTGDDASGFLRPTFTENFFKPEQPLDLTKFYVICPDILGHGRSSKPSDGLRMHFPHYDYGDMVVAEYRLITEKLGVAHLRLLMGTSMGGMHAYLWGERYPQMMDGIVAISALPVEIAGRNRLWRRMIIEAIRNDPEWKNGNYENQPHAYSRMAPLVAMFVRSPAKVFELYPTRAAVDAWYDEMVRNAYAHTDANDRLYQYECSSSYNPTPYLEKITAKMLVIVFADDQINSPEFAVLDQEMPRVKNGRYVIVPVTNESDGERNNLNGGIWGSYLRDFLK